MLVDVEVGAVNQLVAVVQGVSRGGLRVFGGQLVGAEADEGHPDAVVQVMRFKGVALSAHVCPRGNKTATLSIGGRAACEVLRFSLL